jgi:hypothetical protein
LVLCELNGFRSLGGVEVVVVVVVVVVVGAAPSSVKPMQEEAVGMDVYMPMRSSIADSRHYRSADTKIEADAMVMDLCDHVQSIANPNRLLVVRAIEEAEEVADWNAK